LINFSPSTEDLFPVIREIFTKITLRNFVKIAVLKNCFLQITKKNMEQCFTILLGILIVLQVSGGTTAK